MTDAVDDLALPPEQPKRGMVATSHPLAAKAARDVLDAGGSAVDAAVTAAALLTVVDPMSTSLGGDGFALVWDAEKRALHGHNGSGRAPALASIEALQALGHAHMPTHGWLPVTVPGVVEHWAALIEKFGRRTFRQALEPARATAEQGFEVTPVVARDWKRAALPTDHPSPYLPVPAAGARHQQPELAATLQTLQEEGWESMYRGSVAARIANASEAAKGWLRAEDLASHEGSWVAPLEGVYRGHRVAQLPPNGQGIVVLEALGMLDEFPLSTMPEEERTHLQIEAIKRAFEDGLAHVGDPDHSYVDDLLSFDHLETRANSIEDRAATIVPKGPRLFGDTVYVSVVDPDGNACSLINSIYMHFGARVTVDGVVMQNRGHLFSVDPAHPGALGPGRRPYHTILPAMVFRHDAPWIVFGVVGGPQQPQAQVQLLVKMIDLGMAPQDAVDAPRFRWMGGRRVALETGTPKALREALAARGHDIADDASTFGYGGAQVVFMDVDGPKGASDPRKDGVALEVIREPAT